MSQELVPVTAGSRPRRHLRLRLLTAVRRQTGKRRVWDLLDRLQRDLERAQELNVEQTRLIEQLQVELESANKAAWNAIDRADELERKLQLAVEANEENSHRVSFSFPARDGDEPADVTQPMSAVDLERELTDTEVIPTISPVELLKPVRVESLMIAHVSSSTTGTHRVMAIGSSPMASLDPTHAIPTIRADNRG